MPVDSVGFVYVADSGNQRVQWLDATGAPIGSLNLDNSAGPGGIPLDVTVRLAAPIAAGGDTDAEIRLAPGGQAANVASWASALGADARFIGKRGSDDAGRLAASGLEERGVEVVGPAEGRNGVVCALVSADGERSMAADRGAAAELRPEEIDPSWLAACDHLFVSGYALMREPVRAAALRAAELARSAGAVVSADLASWSAIRDAGTEGFREIVLELAPELRAAEEAGHVEPRWRRNAERRGDR